MNNPSDERRSWWRQKRRQYNIGLIGAGILAFFCFVIVLSLFHRDERFIEIEVTLFTILFQAVGYFIMMLIANVFYNLGSLAERLCSPRQPEGFRKLLFNCGFIFSIALPFTVPGLLLYLFLTVPVID